LIEELPQQQAVANPEMEQRNVARMHVRKDKEKNKKKAKASN